MRLLSWFSLFCLLLLTSPASAQQNETPGQPAELKLRLAWAKKLGSDMFDSAVAYDLNADGRYELITTDLGGRIAVFQGADGGLIWQDRHSGSKLHEPLPGRFIGAPRPQILLFSAEGRYMVYDGLRNMRLAEGETGATMPPTLFPDTSGTDRDLFLITTSDFKLQLMGFNAQKELEVVESFNLKSRASFSPQVFQTSASQQPLIVCAESSGQVEIYQRGKPDSICQYRVWQNVAPASMCALASLDTKDQLQIVYCDVEGSIHAANLQLNRGSYNHRQNLTLSDKATGPPIVAPLNADGLQAVVAINRNEITRLGASSEAASVQRKRVNRAANAAAIIAYDETGGAAFVIGEENGYLARYTVTRQGLEGPSRQAIQLNFANAPILVAPFSRIDTRQIFVLDASNGEARLYDLPADEADSEALWLCYAGSFARDCRADSPSFGVMLERNKNMRRQFEKYLTEANQLASEKQFVTAQERAYQALALDPLSERARELLTTSRVKGNLTAIIFISILTIVLVFAGAVYAAMCWLVGRQRRLGLEAEERGDLDSAATHLQNVAARRPKDLELCTRLGNIYFQLGQFDTVSLPVFRRCREIAPQQANYLIAIGMCLVQTNAEDPESLALIEAALDVAPQQTRIERYLGVQRFKRGEKEKALKMLRNAALRDKNDAEALRMAVDLCIELNSLDDSAARLFKRAWDERREDARYLDAYSSVLLNARRFDDEAETVCKQALSIDREMPSALKLRSTLAIGAGDIDLAEECARLLLKQDPQNAEGRWLLCQCVIARNQTDMAALELLLGTLDDNPDDPALWRHAVRCIGAQAMDHPRAEEILRHARELNPDDSLVARNAARFEQLRENHDEAIRLLSDLVRNASSQSNEDLLLLAESCLATKRRDQLAETALREAHRQQPEDVKTLQALSATLIELDRLDKQALGVYQRMLEQGANDQKLVRQYILALHHNKRYEEVTQALKSMNISVGDDSKLRHIFAEAALKSHNLDAAIQDFRGLLQQNPKDEHALVNLAIAFAEKGATDAESQSYYNQALKLRPKDPSLLRAMGRVEARNGHDKIAIEFFQRALQENPEIVREVMRDLAGLIEKRPASLVLRWYLARIYIDLKEFPDAIEALNRIVELDASQMAKAIKGFDLILSVQQSNASALTNRGRLHLAVDNLEYARMDLEKVLANNPNDLDAGNLLLEVYDKLLARQDDPELRFRLGQAAYRMQDYDKAIAAFQATVKDQRWENNSAMMLGRCFFAKGMLDLALQEFRKLPITEELKELLYEMGTRYEKRKDVVGAKSAYRLIFASDINYRDVRDKFEKLSGSSSHGPIDMFETSSMLDEMGEDAQKRYEMIEEVGRGAMGVVYKARDKELEEIVALKVLPDNLSKNSEVIKRFKREARAARKLSHPHIVRIYDIGEEGGRKYLSMECVDGKDLKQHIRGDGVTRTQAVKFTRQIADALAYAHHNGIIHRDIKPANILINRGEEVKVTDFGIAKIMEADDATATGAVLGTPLYMPPEQITGKSVDQRSDIYSLGILFYECLNGRPPFTKGDMAYQHLEMAPPPIEGLDPNIQAILDKCLAKKPEDRYQSCEELIEDIDAL
ncbi:protein kinase [Candidatus Sumerlaeota bacterium]|nr:protein kinase [Candidatus Sumerlaeota bacterium]